MFSGVGKQAGVSGSNSRSVLWSRMSIPHVVGAIRGIAGSRKTFFNTLPQPSHYRIKGVAVFLLSFLLLTLLTGPAVWAAEDTSAPADAKTAVKRIGYLEAGSFWLYDRTWDAFRKEMSKFKDIRCEYPEDARFSPGWEPEKIRKLPEIAEALLKRDDLDLVVGMGTAAVKALLAANNGQKPILGMGMADPIAAGVVKSAEHSGIKNFTCRVTVDRWSNMFRVFYDVVRFKKLGMMYPDTKDGRVYAALDDAEAVASELGFSLVKYDKLSSAESVDECAKGLDELHKEGIDAFFIGPLNCFDIEKKGYPELVKKLNKWDIPTFARDGTEYVKAGALMGFATWDFGPIGLFLAKQAQAILTGTSPGAIFMLDRAEPSIALNLEVAKSIGFDFPFDILLAADELYEKITLPSKSSDK